MSPLASLGQPADPPVVHRIEVPDRIDLQTGKARAIALPPQVDLRRFGWAGEHRVLFSFGASVRGADGEVYASRLMAHDLRTDTAVFIGRRDGGLAGDDFTMAFLFILD